MADRAQDFRFRHDVPVRFRDIDAMGHAHHAQAFVYFEEARWAYWRQVVGGGTHVEAGYVLAESRVRWHARVLWPQVVSVGVRVVRLGRKHFEMEYEIIGAADVRLVSGASVQVMYDYERESSVGISPSIAEALTAFDGPFDR